MDEKRAMLGIIYKVCNTDGYRPYRAVRTGPPADRNVNRQLTGTRTTCYRTVLPTGTVFASLPPEIEEEGEPGVRHCSPDPFTRAIRRSHAISSPRMGRRNVSPHGEKKQVIARGLKKHLKRLNAPKHWMLDKLGGALVSQSFQFGQKGIPYLNTYDGRTIRYPDPLIKANDTIKLDLETNKIVDFIKFDVGNVVMVTGGRNTGRVGVIKNREKHKGSFETIHVQDATGHEFATRLGNVFTVGKGTRPWVSLPKGKGIKLSIIEEARKRLAAAGAAATA
ncbi:hypothetical protein B296_00051542 [Ensete ventricosum]|uniref:KOW domain-containing protein n=1 Tax=Ensete ventricosum TaxID=4639 RepID=A0A426XA46_ENSVE|nr:hypothetical protein B296_00051542 [Ensete ventricosum]